MAYQTRCNNKMSPQVISCFKILMIEDLENVPQMKTIQRKFLKMVEAKPPDGGCGTEEDFVELFEAKEFLLNYLKTNCPED